MVSKIIETYKKTGYTKVAAGLSPALSASTEQREVKAEMEESLINCRNSTLQQGSGTVLNDSKNKSGSGNS